MPVVGERDLAHEARDRGNLAKRDTGMIAGDNPSLFKLAQPHPAGRGREAGLFCQSKFGNAAIALNRIENSEVDGV